jgi:phospholipid transport system substrate-binding protein
MTGRRLLAFASLLLLTPLSPDVAHAGDPTEQLKADVGRVFRILADLPDRHETRARHLALEEASRAVFDFPEMARRALGRTWDERTDAERDTFMRLLGARVEQHLAALEPYGGAAITWLDETVEGERAVVRSRVTPGAGRDLALDYRLIRRGDRWLVWDVVMDNASLVGHYRAQFQRIMRTASYERLLEKLAER